MTTVHTICDLDDIPHNQARGFSIIHNDEPSIFLSSGEKTRFMHMLIAVRIPVLTWNGCLTSSWIWVKLLSNVPRMVPGSELMMAIVSMVPAWDSHLKNLNSRSGTI
jgi:hypothetical protein